MKVRCVACERDGVKQSGHDKEANMQAPCPVTLVYGFGASYR